MVLKLAKKLSALVLILGFCLILPSPSQAESGELPFSKSPEVTLTDLRDLGLILQQIKQQAINIYMEATRRKVHISSKPIIQDVKFIKHADINSKAEYLKTRPEWLTYYVGTMEPLIHLFNVNVKQDDKDADYILVPKDVEDEFKSLLTKYDDGSRQMNESVTEIFDNISEKNNNILIAKAAVKLYETADGLEKARQDAFKLIKNAKSNKKVKIKHAKK